MQFWLGQRIIEWAGTRKALGVEIFKSYARFGKGNVALHE